MEGFLSALGYYYIVTYWGSYSRWIFISNPKIQHTTVQYNQQLYKHIRTIHRRAIGPLARQNSTSVYSPSLTCHSLAPTIDYLYNSRDPQETPSTGPSFAICHHELTFLQSVTQTHVCVYLPRSLNTNSLHKPIKVHRQQSRYYGIQLQLVYIVAWQCC
jgi:hypothetical protein